MATCSAADGAQFSAREENLGSVPILYRLLRIVHLIVALSCDDRAGRFAVNWQRPIAAHLRLFPAFGASAGVRLVLHGTSCAPWVDEWIDGRVNG